MANRNDTLPKGEATVLLRAWGKGGLDEERLFAYLQPRLQKHARVLLFRNQDLLRKIEVEELVNEFYVRLRKTVRQEFWPQLRRAPEVLRSCNRHDAPHLDGPC